MLLLFIVSIAERITFKVLVDRMESYRYFFAQMIAFVYIPPMFTVVAAKVIRPVRSRFIMARSELTHG